MKFLDVFIILFIFLFKKLRIYWLKWAQVVQIYIRSLVLKPTISVPNWIGPTISASYIFRLTATPEPEIKLPTWSLMQSSVTTHILPLTMLLYFKTSLGNLSQSTNSYEWCAKFLPLIQYQTLHMIDSKVSVVVGSFPWKIRSFLACQINKRIPCHIIIHSSFLLTRVVYAMIRSKSSMLSASSRSSSSHSWILAQIAAAYLHLYESLLATPLKSVWMFTDILP